MTAEECLHKDESDKWETVREPFTYHKINIIDKIIG